MDQSLRRVGDASHVEVGASVSGVGSEALPKMQVGPLVPQSVGDVSRLEVGTSGAGPGAIPKTRVDSLVPSIEPGLGSVVPVLSDGGAGSSQASDEQGAIIHEMCRHVEHVIAALSSQDSSSFPPDISRAVDTLKSKMVVFAGESNTPKLPSEECSAESADESSLSDSSEESAAADLASSEPCPRSSVGALVCRSGLASGRLESLKLANASWEERLIVALEKLDMRTVPAPEPYDRMSGQSLAEFLKLFEDYCHHSFRGSDTLWVAELGRFLVGEMHQAFVAHRSPGDSYYVVKKRLLKWYDESKSRREAGSRNAFSRATIGADESVRLYAARLENLFRHAFPKGKVETSRTLLDKFLKSIPRKCRRQVKGAVGLKEVDGKSLSWSQIIKLVGSIEETFATDVSSDEEASSWTVMPAEVRPVSALKRQSVTQHSQGGNEVGTLSRYGFGEQYPVPRTDGAGLQPSFFSEQQRSLALVCHFCGKLGHIQKDCRRRLGLCLVCGAPDHQVSSCPTRQAERDGGRFGASSAAGSRGPDTRRARFEDSQGHAGNEGASLNSRAPVWRESRRN